MDTKDFRLLSILLWVAAGFIYAIERIGSTLAQSQEISAMYAIHMFDGTPKIHITGFWDNAFVPLLTVSGFLLFVYSFAKK